ncbi:MAG: secretin N-terminal domain-containing protein [Vicinamibacteria bacterium]
MKSRIRVAVPLCVLLSAAFLSPDASVAQEQQLQILTIRNRPAEDLVALVRPLLGPGGSVTASGDKLIVSASPRALAEVARVVRELDVAPRSLWISVAQEASAGASGRSAEIAGRPPREVPPARSPRRPRRETARASSTAAGERS